MTFHWTKSRLAAVALLAGAALWIGSGIFRGSHAPANARTAQQETATPLFRVSVLTVNVQPQARRLVLSGRTEADRKASAIARSNGIVTSLSVRRGSKVKAGEVIAELSDEAREARVSEARARLTQRREELLARLRLIQSGNLAALERPRLEAELKGAQASLAQAEAERERGQVLAPLDGVVNEVSGELGQAVQPGQSIAEVIALNPMLAVADIPERQLSGVKVGDKVSVRTVAGQTLEGTLRFVSSKASPQTRTYRIEAAVPNAQGQVPDGITCELVLSLAPVPAAEVPRSSLTFSSEGKLGVRLAAQDGVVAFAPVQIVMDGESSLWVSGVPNGARVIVQGQDFVKEGEKVEVAS